MVDAGKVFSALWLLLRQRDFRVVVACSAAMGLAVSFVLPFMSMFGTLEVKMSLGVFGLFMTAVAVGSIVISTVVAHFSDTRFSRRGVMLVGSAAGALGYLGYAFAREIWQLTLIGTFVLGIASGTFSQLFAYSRELIERSKVPPEDAPLYMNAIRMTFALSWTVGPALAAATLRQYSFKGVFLGASALHVVFFALVLFFIPRGDALRTKATSKSSGGVLGLFGDVSVLAWFAAFVLVLGAHTISMNNMSLFVLKVLGGTEANVGVIFSLAPLFELPFMLYFGLLATRMESAKLIRLALLLAVFYYAGLCFVREPYQIYPLQFLSAAIVSVTNGVAITFFQNLLPDRLGAATNLYSNAFRVGSTSAYMLFGAAATQLGHRGTYVLCTCLCVVSVLLSGASGKPRTASA